ncbi:NADPH:quinone oxidoreductase family protein [Sphingopyxis sp. Q841]|uniref:NADPH:quinone oxidoreductase family protein n=1 Tax=Sphingopyxis sp. Q841 TaxID=3458250 RepID=UPI004035752C
MMRALLSKVPGGPDSLEISELPDPDCGPGEVVVDVYACGVNFPDLLIIEDRYQFRPPRPFAPGGEVAGTIRRVGEGVEKFAVGDRVIAGVGWNGMADQVACDAAKCVAMPEAMSFEHGAAFFGTYGTSYHALKQRANLQPGDHLLVLGAAGGVGSAAVELGRAMGADVVAAVSTPEKADFALAHGAHRSLVYPSDTIDTKALARLFKEAAPSGGFDKVYDSVGGAYAEAAFRSLAWRGRFLVVGFPAGIPSLPLNLALLKGAEAVGVFYGAFVEKEPEAYLENVRDLFGLYEAGRICPAISHVAALEEAGSALKLLGSRQARGKIVIKLR